LRQWPQRMRLPDATSGCETDKGPSSAGGPQDPESGHTAVIGSFRVPLSPAAASASNGLLLLEGSTRAHEDVLPGHRFLDMSEDWVDSMLFEPCAQPMVAQHDGCPVADTRLFDSASTVLTGAPHQPDSPATRATSPNISECMGASSKPLVMDHSTLLLPPISTLVPIQTSPTAEDLLDWAPRPMEPVLHNVVTEPSQTLEPLTLDEPVARPLYSNSSGCRRAANPRPRSRSTRRTSRLHCLFCCRGVQAATTSCVQAPGSSTQVALATAVHG
jgi:hypothetical protein